MITRVANLVLASLMAFATVASWFGATARVDGITILIDLVVACWLAAAIGLFFGSRLAWSGSLIGVGLLSVNFLRMIGVAWKLGPTLPDQNNGLGLIILLGFLGLLLTISIIVGLVRQRRTLFSAAAGGAQSTKAQFTQIVLPAGLWIVANILLIIFINVGASLLFGLVTALGAAIDCSNLKSSGARGLGIPFKPVVVFAVCAFFLWGFGFIWYLVMRYRVQAAPVELEAET